MKSKLRCGMKCVVAASSLLFGKIWDGWATQNLKAVMISDDNDNEKINHIWVDLFSLPSIVMFGVLVYIRILEYKLNRGSYYFHWIDGETETLGGLTTLLMKPQS